MAPCGTGRAFVHVDVFADDAYSGNPLVVFTDARGLDARQMLRITQELQHFETVFLAPAGDDGTVPVRVFDLVEELPFAGHPLLGAAAVLHEATRSGRPRAWRLRLPDRVTPVRTTRTAAGFEAWMAQGVPEVRAVPDEWRERARVAAAFGLDAADLDAARPLGVASTGLPYLVVPVAPGALDRARVAEDLSPLVDSLGARYAVLFDESARELRHWSNDGRLEDVATGSAAGAIGAWRLQQGLADDDETVVLAQGRHVGRASRLAVRARGGDAASPAGVEVGGGVVVVGRGVLERVPRT
jgi:PhzF family phenazine biosynthesis protein